MDVGIVETNEYPFIIDYLSSGAEFIQGSLGLKGRLKQCVSYWGLPLLPHHSPPPPFVLDVISEGYKLPLIRVPDPCFKTNNRSAELHPSFVKEAFIKLLAADCSEECLEPPYRVNLLSVAEGKKLRPVIDLRHVNSFLFRHSFKYEDLHSLSKG